MFKCAELEKVREALEEKGWKWENKSSYGMERIWFHVGALTISVINGEFSYGGNIGLLETMPPTNQMPTGDGYDVIEWANDVEGCLTADEVINKWINPS